MKKPEDFLPKNRTGKYSRNEYVSGAEAYAKHYAKELVNSITDKEIQQYAKAKGKQFLKKESELDHGAGAEWMQQQLLNELNNEQ